MNNDGYNLKTEKENMNKEKLKMEIPMKKKIKI